jgi:hypothetical protein
MLPPIARMVTTIRWMLFPNRSMVITNSRMLIPIARLVFPFRWLVITFRGMVITNGRMLLGKDKAMILSSGFDVRSDRTKADILPAPVNLRVTNTQIEGQLKLKWNAVKKKNLYAIVQAVDAPVLMWEPAGESTKASITINNLVGGQKYWYRVSVINSAGMSGWSDPISGRPIQD